MALYDNDSITNSDLFDLTKWYLGLPIDSSGGTSGVSASIYNLAGFEDPYFYDSTDGGMVFTAPVTGATTSGSHGARSELRETNPDGSLAKWTVAQGGTMTATLKIDSLPYYTATNTPAKMIIGQIHGSSNELCRLYDDNGLIYFKDDKSGSTTTEHTYQLTDAAGNHPTVALGETFSYEIDAHNGMLTVKVFVGNDVYTGSTTINSYWDTDTLYFKAGAYLGVSKDGVSIQQGYGTGEDTFYALDYSHTAGQGLNGLAQTSVNGTSGDDYLQASPTTGSSISGGGGNDHLTGHDANDILNGGAGNDVLSGYGGTDVSTGGTGTDTFVVTKGEHLTVTDFTLSDGDLVQVEGFTATELATAHLAQSGSDAVLTFSDGTSVTFQNTQTGALTANDLVGDVGGTLSGITATVTPTPVPAPTPDPTPAPAPTPVPSPTTTSTGIYDTAPAETLTVSGTSGNDKLNANSSIGTDVNGLAGNDVISGHNGNDALHGGDGADIVHGYWGNDWINGDAGNDTLYGDNGDDTLIGGLGNDTVAGGSGHDVFVQHAGDQGLYVTDFTTSGTTSNDKFVLEGYSGTDISSATLTQTSGGAMLKFTNGDAVTFHNVSVSGLNDSNLLVDNGGTMTGYFTEHAAGATPTPTPTPVPAPTPDPTTAPSPTPTSTGLVVDGTSGADTLNADHTIATTITGEAGNDSLVGHDGNDLLMGQGGSDKLYGYWGDDILSGGSGADTLSGGNGADTFLFKAADLGTGVDTITDYTASQGDKIDISDVLHGHYTAGTDVLTDYVQIANSGSHSILSVDLDGKGSAYGWQQVTTINGTGLTDEQALMTAGHLIVS